MVYFKTWLLFIRTISSYIFFPKSNSDYSLAGKSLFALTFRYPAKDKDSFSFFLKKYISVLADRKIQQADACHVYQPGGIYFYDNDSSATNENARKAHIDYFLKKPIDGSIWKDKLLGYSNFPDNLLQIFFVTIVFLKLLPLSLFAKYKGSLGLILVEYIELVNLLKIVKEKQVKELYYYSIYEKDSNITSIALQRQGVKVYKITSLTPLKFWNSTIVAADKLILCDMNQLDELQDYKQTIKVNAVEVWGPETISGSATYYNNGDKYDTNKSTIGFYSTATYIRAMQGEVDQKNSKQNEEAVKSYLAEYLKANPGKKLIVFPHPREKKPENKEMVEAHYKEFFGGLNYEIFQSPLPSSQCFDAADLGVAMYSSVMYERLYFGLKCLMMPFGKDGMELPGKALNYICAKDKAELFSKIDQFSTYNVVEYFEKTGLKQSPFMIEALGKKKS